MTPEMIILLMFLSLLVLLMMGFPLSFTLGGLGILFGFVFWNPAIAKLFVRTTTSLTTNISYVVTPLFIFMGALLESSGVAKRLFNSTYILLGKLRGGLGIITVVICALLAAATGIIGAAITLMGMLAFPMMMENNYDIKLASGAVMAGGCLGTIIPPSIILVIYGGLAQISIGKLFAAGLFPGLLLAGLYAFYIGLKSFIDPEAGPPISQAEAAKYDTNEKIIMAIKSVLPTLILIVMVLGSIFIGIATPTEAAAMGCFGAGIIALMYGKLSWKMLKKASFKTMKTAAKILWIILTAKMFTTVFMGLGGREVVSDLILNLGLGKWLTLIILLFILFVMGMIIDSYGVMLIGIPLFTPIVYNLGFDPIWFAIIFTIMIQISYLSPPFAYAVFYLKGVAERNLSTRMLYTATVPFLGLQIIGVIILSLFPKIITWLPSVLF